MYKRLLHTEAEVEQITGIPVKSLQKMRMFDEPENIPFIKIGGRVRYVASDIEKWLAERQRRGNRAA